MANASKRIKLDRRPLPPELLCEMHKFLPIEQQLDLIVWVPSRIILLNNGPRVRRTLKHIKKRIRNLVAQHHGTQNWEELDEENRSHREFCLQSIRSSCNLKPEYSALIRFLAAFTPVRSFYLTNRARFYVEPATLIEDLLFQLANSGSMPTLEYIRSRVIDYVFTEFSFLYPLIGNKHLYSEGTYALFDKFVLKNPRNGQTLQIIYARMDVNLFELVLFILKPIANKWLRIVLNKRRNVFYYKEIEKLNETVKKRFDCLEEPGNDGTIIKGRSNVRWDPEFDMFLYRGAQLTKFRHFQMDKDIFLYGCPRLYEEELLRYMAETSHPEHMLETIELKKEVFEWLDEDGKPTLLLRIWSYCQDGIPAGGQMLAYQKSEFKILQGTAKPPITEYFGDSGRKRTIYWMQFTLVNGPTNGEYVFDVEAEFTEEVVKRDETIAIKIRKRKVIDYGFLLLIVDAQTATLNRPVPVSMQNMDKANSGGCSNQPSTSS